MKIFLLVLIILIGVIRTSIAQNSDTISIENVNVITMLSEEVLPNQRVMISNGKIIKIESSVLPLQNNQIGKIDGKNKKMIAIIRLKNNQLVRQSEVSISLCLN